ncbi:MAG: tetratricopeptide repeat protein [Gemmatimonadaceae bacterium]|nr:tetratricopeptide repeat protein [Gemmatimonadaceae bacterium]
MSRFLKRLAPLALLPMAACFATREDVRLLQADVLATRVQHTQSDSATRAQLSQVIVALGTVVDSLSLVSGRLNRFQGDARGELHSLSQQLIQVQELSGQSQRRLQELRSALEQRTLEAVPVPSGGALTTPPSTSAQPGAPTNAPAPVSAVTSAAPAPGPNTLFQLSLDQLRRGSASAARTGFQELLRQYPTSDVSGEAQFYLGEAFSAEGNRSAADSAYAIVAERYPASPRASTALYKRALGVEWAGNSPAARALLTQLIERYPRSDEAALARERLRDMK